MALAGGDKGNKFIYSKLLDEDEDSVTDYDGKKTHIDK